MKINVVAVKSGWILTKIAERIVANAPDDVDMTLSSPRRNGNNFYVDVTNCYMGHLGGKEVGLFTHVHANDPSFIKNHWFSLDHTIHMSKRSCDIFENDPRIAMSNGIHSCKMPGEVPEGFNYQKPVIGTFQRGQHEGKGFNMMRRLANIPAASDFNWTFVGGGWNDVAKDLHKKTKVVSYSDEELIWPNEYLDVYNEVDYVLVPSKWEGGPMGLLEAAALGKSVIAAKVGWVGNEMCADYTFEPGSENALAAILGQIIYKRKRARKIVEKLSYKDYANHVVKAFRRIK